MNSKDFKNLEALSEKERNRKMTKEEAIQSLIDAGIINRDKKFMPPYKNLERIIVKRTP